MSGQLPFFPTSECLKCDFEPIRVSSKFFICGLPLTGDSYRDCSFACRYCFSNNRVIAKGKGASLANIAWLERKLRKVYDENDVAVDNFLEHLLKDRITWHYGGLSDPFQPIERYYQITRHMVELTNRYDVSILFSTKTDTPYFWSGLDPKRHAFQLSISNLENRMDIEPFVPPIERRIEFYNELKNRGFRVGIRIQPFIPGVSGPEIIDQFQDADHFTIESLKLVPQNKEQREFMLDLIQMPESNFTQMGLLNLKPEIRMRYYQPVIDKLEAYGIPYSIADNDLHHLGTAKCCCGDALISKATEFNNTSLFKKFGRYSKDEALCALGSYSEVKANYLFTSNRQEGCTTIREFLEKRLERETSPASVKFAHAVGQKQLRFEVSE